MSMKMEKLMEKKKDSGKELDPMYKDSKMSMLKALHKEMSDMMAGGLKDHQGMKKVEVASDSPEGLKHGLDKAKDLLEGSDEEEAGESADEESNEDQLGQDEADEHDVHGDDRFGVDPEMEEAAEHGDSEEPEHEGEMDEEHLSDEDIAHLEDMLAKAKMKRMGK